jgi:DNA-binding beta-propeller fold protein YncE
MRVQRSLLLAALLAITVAPLPTLAASSTAPAPLGRVRFIQHGLAVQPPKKKMHRGKVRDPLFTRYGIRTIKGQRATIAFHDGSILYVNQRTDAILNDPHVTVVKRGEVNLADEPGGKHTVKTGNAVASAIGTNFDVRAKKKHSLIIVVSGSVLVKNKKGAVTVKANQETTVSGANPPTAPQTVDAAAAIGWTTDLASGGWQRLNASAVFNGKGAINAATDSGGNVYVTAFGGNRVYKISPTGKVIMSFGTKGKGPGQFTNPYGIAVDASGNIFVVDNGNSRVEKFSPTGKFINAVGHFITTTDQGLGTFYDPEDAAIDSAGNIYVVEQGHSRVQELSNDLKPLALFGDTDPRQDLTEAHGVTVDSAGNVYIADTADNRIVKYSPSGQFLLGWGGKGAGPGKFNSPEGLGIDRHNNVYVADTLNNRIEKFSQTGEFEAVWGAQDHVAKPFDQPTDAAITPDDTVYEVEDNYLWRLQGG